MVKRVLKKVYPGRLLTNADKSTDMRSVMTEMDVQAKICKALQRLYHQKIVRDAMMTIMQQKLERMRLSITSAKLQILGLDLMDLHQ